MVKAKIRKLYLEKRKELSSEDVEKMSLSITQKFFDSVDLSTIKVIHCFLPIKKFNEVNTWHIIYKIWKDYPSIKIATSITEEGKLMHVLIDKKTKYKDDKWGIPTPENCPTIDAKKIDVVITPLLAFDKNNNRVGYGKGYYDKFFSECTLTIKKIGVSLFPALEELIEDVNEFDVPLDKVITSTI